MTHAKSPYMHLKFLAFTRRMVTRKAANKPDISLPITSSVPLKLPPEQEGLFSEVLSILESDLVPYAVAGAFALQQHTGICHFTKDLDLYVTPPNASQALNLLEDKGFDCEICDPVWLAKAHRDDYFIDLITGMSNGAITVDDSWIKRSHPAVIVKTRTRVLAPEELIASKLFVTRRERFDGADIAHVIYALKGELEWNRILELAGEHWELVLWNLVLFRYVYPAQSAYVPQALWKDLLSRFSSELRSPNARARFRGSLIDDKMFAIDTDEWGLENLMEEYQQKRMKISPRQASAVSDVKSGRIMEIKKK